MADFFSGGMTGLLSLLISVFCVLLSISIHEFAHGYMAYKLGDDTARVMGRLSVNPLHHLDPIGALCLLFFHFGWAKPVPVNPSKFTKVKIKTGMVLTAIAGPLANFILGFIAMILIRVVILYMADFAVSELLFIILYEYLSGLIDTYTIAGLVFKIPVQAAVMTFGFSNVPDDTKTTGNGATKAPPLQVILLISIPPFILF